MKSVEKIWANCFFTNADGVRQHSVIDAGDIHWHDKFISDMKTKYADFKIVMSRDREIEEA